MALLGEDWTLPGLTPLNREWFSHGEIRVQTCEGCDALQHPPEEICSHCGSMAFRFTTVAPRGTVHSYTVAHYAVNRALTDRVPYAVVLVSLDQHPEVRIIGNVLDTDPDEIRIGMAVEAMWEERTNADGDTVQLLQWHAA
ncbi:MAG: Zn-ribbon domain-containing OB-fold protein [Acidimicrobiales bacterium]